MMITVRRLESGYWHVRSDGPCNWSQPPYWPCDRETLKEYAGSWASDEFLNAAFVKATQEAQSNG